MKGSVSIENPYPGCIELGFSDTGIADPKMNRLIWENNGEIVFKGSASFAFGDKISCRGKLSFGNHFVSNVNSAIVCNKEITFGDDCLLSWDCLFIDTDYHSIYSGQTRINPDAPILIGNHVWFGCRTTVLKGVQVEDNCIIAAGSLLSKGNNPTRKTQNAIISGDEVLRKSVEWK